MAKQIYTIRKDFVESKMSHYFALGDYDKYETWKDVGESLHMDIDEFKVKEDAMQRRKVYQEWYADYKDS